MSFSGTYDTADVSLLLQLVALEPTGTAEKERLIQSGVKHYSEILSPEAPPGPEYLAIYKQALAANRQKMADAVMALAKGLAYEVEGEIILASLARAGLPIGVLLCRALRQMGRTCHHYGISIIRDRGLDTVAMAHIATRHGLENVIFIDGWTGKGAIAAELANAAPACGILRPRLATLGDIGGFAWMAPTKDDWLIPSGILGGIISGLVSRTILNDDIRLSGGFHGCADLGHLAEHDQTQSFIQNIIQAFDPSVPACSVTPLQEREKRRATATQTITALALRHKISNPNRLKPSIAEATRAILRRRPHKVYLADPAAPDVQALYHLVQRDHIPYTIDPDMLGPYRAITIIEKTS